MLPDTSVTNTLSKERVVTKAMLRAADKLEITSASLSKILGLSQSTISRMRNHDQVLSEGDKAFELAVLFVRFFRSLDAIVGGDEAVARAWLVGHNTALGDKPISQIQTITGLMHVIAYLDSRRAVI